MTICNFNGAEAVALEESCGVSGAAVVVEVVLEVEAPNVERPTIAHKCMREWVTASSECAGKISSQAVFLPCCLI